MSFRRPAVLVALLCAWPLAAAADPAAEQLFRDGKRLLADGKVDEACAKLAASQAIEAKVGTLLNLGDCRERQGKLATAWDVFLEAKALASRLRDDRAAVAVERAAAIAPRRAFLTLIVPAAHRVPGLVITRDDVEVPAAVWDFAAPIDPGRYVIVARAPGHAPQTTTVEVARTAKVTTTIAALVALPPEEEDDDDHEGEVGDPLRRGDPGYVETRVAPAPDVWPPQRTFAVGLLLGLSHEQEGTFGARLLAAIPLPQAALRASLTAKYIRLTDPADVYNTTDVSGLGLGLDYVRMFHRGLGAGGGVGGGLEIRNNAYEDVNRTETWFALRASPLIMRFAAPRLELGVHVEYVVPDQRVVGVVGLDWFVR